MNDAAIPRVSVVMSVWNGRRYLAPAIESVLAQTYPHFELVIVDDGSTDESPQMVEGYAARDARIRLIRAPHRGLVAALNEGCRAARGEFLARTDADDVALPERFAHQLGFFAAHPSVAMVGGAVEVIDPTGEPLKQGTVNPPCEHATIRQRLEDGNCFIHSTIMMRREAWLEVGGYRPLYAEAEDYDLWTRFADRHELAGMKTVLAQYRAHPLQVSVTRLEQQALVALAISRATRIRWRTGVDPLAGCQAITRETSRSLGVDDHDIDTHLLYAYMRCIQGLPSFGLSTIGLGVVREIATSRLLFGALEERFPGSTTAIAAAAAAAAPCPETAAITS